MSILSGSIQAPWQTAWGRRAILWALSLALTSMAAIPAVAEDVDLLLVMAADVSRSIDEAKFKLQRDGYVAAITDPGVMKVIQAAGPKHRIGMIFIEWAGMGETKIVADWASVGNLDEAQRFAAQIAAAPRSFYGRTCIACAIDESLSVIRTSPLKADRRIIDISGDGTNNAGRDIGAARDGAVELGVTVNGIVILSAVPLPFNPQHTHPPGGLLAYYQSNVIGGPGSFAIAAEGFETFGQALRAKLVREISSLGGNVDGRRDWASLRDVAPNAAD